MLEIPDRLRIKASQNDERRSWLAALPGLCRRLGQEWNLQLGKPFDDGHISFVTRATRGSSQVVLKVPLPDSIDLGTLPASARVSEAAALRHWAGDGAARLLEHDHTTGALLLERCVPGSTLDLLSHLDQDRVAATLLARLHQRQPRSVDFVRLADRASFVRETLPARFERCGSPFDSRLLDTAVEMLADLALPTAAVLLHGDFHQHNILAADRQPWLAIDPLPMVGDPNYDAVQYLLFRKGDLADPETNWGTQIRRFCALLGFDTERTKAWLFARLISDALAALTEEGATAAVLEQRQGDLWSARLVLRLLS